MQVPALSGRFHTQFRWDAPKSAENKKNHFRESCKKCHLGKLSEVGVKKIPLHNYTLCSFSIGDRLPGPSWSIPEQMNTILVQEISPAGEVGHFSSQICSRDAIWKLEGGQVWSPILVLVEGERWDFEHRINLQKYLQCKACLQGNLEFRRIGTRKLVIRSHQGIVYARSSFKKPSKEFYAIIK